MQINNKKRKYNKVTSYNKKRKSYNRKWTPVKRPFSAEVNSLDTQFVKNTSYSYFRGNDKLTNTGYCLNAMFKGTSGYQRLGNKIRLKSLQVSGWIVKYTGDYWPPPTKLRIIIVYDKQTNGAAPQLNTILKSHLNVGTPVTDINSMINMGERNRFEILKDCSFYMDGEQVSGNGEINNYEPGTMDNKKLVNFYLKLKGRPTVFGVDANAGTIGDVKSGGLYVYLLDANDDHTGYWNFDGTFRLRFWSD